MAGVFRLVVRDQDCGKATPAFQVLDDEGAARVRALGLSWSAAVRPRIGWRHDRAGARMLMERLAGWDEKYPDAQMHRVVVRDRPVRVLLRYGAEAQLLAVGIHGRGGFAGMLLGSTSQALVYNAPCPLAIVRHGETE